MKLFGYKLGNILLGFIVIAMVTSFIIAIVNYDNRAVYDLFINIALIESVITGILLYLGR